jgi:hypothetical protein
MNERTFILIAVTDIEELGAFSAVSTGASVVSRPMSNRVCWRMSDVSVEVAFAVLLVIS